MIPEQLEILGIDTKWYEPLMKTFIKYNISTIQRQACFIGQCAHESKNFRTLEEDLYYSAAGLMRTWPSRFPSPDVAEQYAKNPEKIANKVYAGRLGNNEEGDGWKFHGRGLIQLTGRDNYERCGKALSIDLISQPDLLVDCNFACLSAGWFWNKAGLNDLADSQDYETMTRRINGGLDGFEDRKAKIAHAKSVLG